MQFYRNLLVQLGSDEKKLVQAVFHNVSTTIEHPKQLTELVSYMDSLDWYNGSHGKSRDDFGDMYEGLLQRTLMKPNLGQASTLPASADQNHYPSAEAAAARSGARPGCGYGGF